MPQNFPQMVDQGRLLTAGQLVDETGTSYAVKQVDGKPRVSSMPYLYDIAEGNIPGRSVFTKIGYNADVGLALEDITTAGGSYSWIPAGGTALDVVSSSADDTIAGTGIQKVKVGYLTTDYVQHSEIIEMNGTTPVALTETSVLRVNGIAAQQVGTGGHAAGIITVENVGGAVVYRSIEAEYTRDRDITFTVPLGKVLYITSIFVSSGYTTAGKIVRWTGRAQVNEVDPEVKLDFFMPFFAGMTEDANIVKQLEIPIRIPATADVTIMASSIQAGSYCSCVLRGWSENE